VNATKPGVLLKRLSMNVAQSRGILDMMEGAVAARAPTARYLAFRTPAGGSTTEEHEQWLI
jgi:hypothetical protein